MFHILNKLYKQTS